MEGHIYKIIFVVNMPPSKILPPKLANLCYIFTFEMPLFYILNATLSATLMNSKIYDVWQEPNM